MNKAGLQALLQPVVEDLGYEFVGMEFNPSASHGLLRIYIDRPGTGVVVDDCARVSREVSAVLDVEDPIPGQYTLEVSSPGLDRPLFTPEQFARFAGHKVKVSVLPPVDGRRKFTGVIVGVDGADIHLEVDGEPLVLSHASIQKARIQPEFDE